MQAQSLEFADATVESQTKIKAIFEALRVQEERRNGWWVRYAALTDQSCELSIMSLMTVSLIEGVISLAAATIGDAAADDACASVEKTVSFAERKFKMALLDKGVAKGGKGTLDVNLLKTMMRGV